MIKKINYLLILIASIWSIYLAITKNNTLILFIKDISVVLTISALYIVQKIFKIKIPDSINFIYIVFIFMAHLLGVVVDLYTKVYWYDKFIHFLSGILTSFAAIYIIVKFKKDNNIIFTMLFIIAFTLMIASLWEIFEYLSSYYFNLDPQKVLLTGVSDTMGDIIVAFLGSILISLLYYYEYKENHNMIIKKFVKQI